MRRSKLHRRGTGAIPERTTCQQQQEASGETYWKSLLQGTEAHISQTDLLFQEACCLPEAWVQYTVKDSKVGSVPLQQRGA